MISRLSQTWLPVVSTSHPRAKRSSAIAGVRPNPPAAFSALAMSKSILCVSTTCARWSRTILRPGLPKMSPIKSICIRSSSILTGSVRQLSVHQELIIRRRPKVQVLDVLRVHQHVVEIPEIYVRKIARHQTLDLGVNLLTLLLVNRAAPLRDQLVYFRIGVVPAIGAFGSIAGRVKYILKHVRVLIGVPDPAQRVELKRALGHIRIKRRKLKAADLQINP